MNITIDKAVVEQALAALEKTMGAWGGTCAWHADVKAAITELRAQAEQPAVPKPVVVSQGWTPTERELESVAEQIMRGIRSIGLWDARLGYTIRVLRDWLSASPSPAPAVPAHRVKSWGHCVLFATTTESQMKDVPERTAQMRLPFRRSPWRGLSAGTGADQSSAGGLFVGAITSHILGLMS